tara:strand:+ start:27 stop:284 length:258 start_codon:yes stop_codon:yes gene_type:complete
MNSTFITRLLSLNFALELNYINNMRKKIGVIALSLAAFAVVWLLLGMANIVPFLIELPQETSTRAHASLAVVLLLIGSWAFWNED